ncbi:hypothetical protein [Pseudomonas fluorescens]|uniref:hypothetical protein n=1 Tax=Pseudomonas fluorescens TaxID=294 RepID=UPI003D00E0E7
MSTGLSYTTFMCAGTVILVADELSGSDRQDGLDALLYSQTVASRKFPDFAEFESWMRASKMAIRTLGGILFSDPNVSHPVPISGGFTLGELAQQVLRQWVPAAAVRSLEASLELLSRRASTSPESNVLREHVLQQETRVQFKFGVMSPGVAMAVAAIAFECDEAVVGDILSYRFCHEKIVGNVSISGYNALVEPEDYDLSRDTIISLLGARRQEHIIKLT